MSKNIYKALVNRYMTICDDFIAGLLNIKEDISLHPDFDCKTTKIYLYKLNFALNLYMMSSKKYKNLFPVIIAGIILTLILQSVWICYSYRLTADHLMVDLRDAFAEAYRKEQTYRVPVADIVMPGSVTIESCGREEVMIISKCPEPDTVIYSNPSGLSIESFINRVFVDLREHIVPMNINCLADLFAGMLHDKGIPVYFVIERFDITAGEILDSSLLPDKKQPRPDPSTTIIMDISEKESLRAILDMKPSIVFGRIPGVLVITTLALIMVICCLILVYRHIKTYTNVEDLNDFSAKVPGSTGDTAIESNTGENTVLCKYNIGQYLFDPGKNELFGFGEFIQLNKKENTILYALCARCGNVVERDLLLSENWGDKGLIYSRSLDTYITTLRKYLKKDPSVQIVTIKGVGYKLVYQT